MNARLIAIVATATVGLVGLTTVLRGRNEQAELSVTTDTQLAAPVPSSEPYRIPEDTEPMDIATSVGVFGLTAARGYYGGAGLNVVFPEGILLTGDVKALFLELTEGEFHLDDSPSTSQGGAGKAATALITAGLDYDAHCRGEQGYFKGCDAPSMPYIAIALKVLAERLAV